MNSFNPTKHHESEEVEKAVLVGVILAGNSKWEVEENLDELRQLAETAAVSVADEMTQERKKPDKATFIGKGKVQELKQAVEMHGAKAAIFDDDLTPAQSRNLEQTIDAKIIDRSTLILDIFARHARTREAKTQVELAQLQHLLPRLTRQWSHLSRQVGGIGTRGPGETQLETDRRLIRNRIEALRKQLDKIDRRRSTRRKGRSKAFKVSLVGYTNVGKSTIMNLLTGADVLVENQLFATLDSTVRRVDLDQRHIVLLSDTVGFIRKLPHDLIESFKSTLDEVLDADLLLHVVDVSHPGFKQQISTVNEVLKEIGADHKPTQIVFNKIDLLAEKQMLTALRVEYPGSIFISAARHIRTDQLKKLMTDFIEEQFVESEVEIPIGQSWLVKKIYPLAIITEEIYSDTHVTLSFRCPSEDRSRIMQLIGDAVGESAATGQ